jgi:hypothetical protein
LHNELVAASAHGGCRYSYGKARFDNTIAASTKNSWRAAALFVQFQRAVVKSNS